MQEVWYVSLNQYLMEHWFSSHSFYASHHPPQQAVSFSKTEAPLFLSMSLRPRSAFHWGPDSPGRTLALNCECGHSIFTQ